MEWAALVKESGVLSHLLQVMGLGDEEIRSLDVIEVDRLSNIDIHNLD